PSPGRYGAASGGTFAVDTSTASMPGQVVPFTIANMRKDDGVLFRAEKDGEWVFEQKLPAGEVLDLKPAPRTHYMAVFLHEPHKEAFTVSWFAPQTWLIRRPAPPQPVPPPS